MEQGSACKGRKIVPTTPDKTTTTEVPAEKVFVLLPQAESQEVPIPTAKVPRPRGRPKKLIPTFTVSQGDMSSVQQAPPDEVVKAASKQHIPVFLFTRFHLSFAKSP